MQTYNDYDKALYYTYCCNWDKLLVLMVQTNDQLFSKRIEHFYTLINTARNCQKLINNCALFQYIDHASQKSHVEEVEQIQINYSAILFRRMALFNFISIKVSPHKTFIDKHIFLSFPYHFIL